MAESHLRSLEDEIEAAMEPIDRIFDHALHGVHRHGAEEERVAVVDYLTRTGASQLAAEIRAGKHTARRPSE